MSTSLHIALRFLKHTVIAYTNNNFIPQNKLKYEQDDPFSKCVQSTNRVFTRPAPRYALHRHVNLEHNITMYFYDVSWRLGAST